MRETLRDLMKKCRADLRKNLQRRDKWIKEWPGQLCITCSQVIFSYCCVIDQRFAIQSLRYRLSSDAETSLVWNNFLRIIKSIPNVVIPNLRILKFMYLQSIKPSLSFFLLFFLLFLNRMRLTLRKKRGRKMYVNFYLLLAKEARKIVLTRFIV